MYYYILNSKNQDDLNLAVSYVELLLKNDLIPGKELTGIGVQLVRLAYVMNQTDRAIQILKSKVHFNFFFSFRNVGQKSWMIKVG